MFTTYKNKKLILNLEDINDMTYLNSIIQDSLELKEEKVAL